MTYEDLSEYKSLLTGREARLVSDIQGFGVDEWWNTDTKEARTGVRFLSSFRQNDVFLVLDRSNLFRGNEALHRRGSLAFLRWD